MNAWRRDRFGDQLDRTWDAALAGHPSDEANVSHEHLALLRQFHALDTAPGPDALFVERLAQQWAVGSRSPVRQFHRPVLAQPRPDRAPHRAPAIPLPLRRRWLALAATLLLVLAGASILWLAQPGPEIEQRSIPAVAFEVTPATPSTATSEGTRPLLHTTFDPVSVGVSLQGESAISLEYMVRLLAGEAYRQNGPASGDQGVSVVIVLRGVLDAQSSGPSLVYRQGETVAQVAAPNAPVSLGEGDAWLTSMEDLATAVNSSGGPATLLRFASGVPSDGTYFEFSPVGDYLFAHDPAGPAWPDGPLTIDIQDVSLSKGDTHQIDIRDDQPYLLLTSGTGAVRVSKDGSSRGASTIATSLADYPPGAYTITRDLPSEVDLFLARWTSAEREGPAVTSPVSAPEAETLLIATIDPDLIDAGPEADWSYAGLFTKAAFHPGQQIELDSATWGAGLTTTTVTDGMLSLVSQGPVAVLRAGDRRPTVMPPGQPMTLAAGDTAFYDGSRGVVIENKADTDAAFIRLVAFDPPEEFFPVVPYPENIWGPKTPLVDVGMTQQFTGPVVVTIQQIVLSTAQPLNLEVGENEVVFISTEDGSALQFAQDGSQSPITTGPSTLHDKGPGAYTITRPSDPPVAVYLVRMSNA
jgi:hypothetical protein